MKKYLPFIMVAAAAIATSKAVGHWRPFSSIKATREIIENYEVVRPIITVKDSHLPYPKVLEVTVPTQSKSYSLVLHMNQNVMSGGFTSIYFNQQGRMVKDKNSYQNCYYHGTIEGYSDWTVLMTTCHGLQGEFGVWGSRDNYYHLEPLDKKNPSMDQLHAFYKDSEYKILPGSCGYNGHHTKEDRVIPETNSILNNTYNARVRRQAQTYTLEWMVVSDDAQYTAYGRNLTATVQRALAIANGLDPLYRSLTPSVRINLIGSVTFTSGNMFDLTSDPSILLDRFQDYVEKSLASQHHDSIMLLTGIDLKGSAMGIASMGTICNSRSSVGLSQDGGRSLSGVVTTAAHGLGHIFNMGHDKDYGVLGVIYPYWSFLSSDDRISCTCPDSRCIMAVGSSSFIPTRFSSCSMSDFNELISTNKASCLFSTPTMYIPLGDGRCGNGIQEGNEACDCGDVGECTDPCCNAQTCQLATEAQCSDGQCCDSQCQFKPRGTQCRAKSGKCDIEESCTGASGKCPEDVHAVDGTPCESDTGYCVEGSCPTHRAQCREAWNSLEGGTRCYNLNIRGDRFGHCGHATSTYVPCQSRNILCGQLQCSGGSYQGIYNVGGTTARTTLSNGKVCRSFTVRVTSDELGPGLVAFGTKCGDGRLCMSQRRCVSVSNLNAPTCPVGSNGLTCSGIGRGICNNLGQCSCLDGFSGSTCEPSMENQEAPPTNNKAAAIAGGIIGGIVFLLLHVVCIIMLVILLAGRRPSKASSSYQDDPPKQSTSIDNRKNLETSSDIYHSYESLNDPDKNLDVHCNIAYNYVSCGAALPPLPPLPPPLQGNNMVPPSSNPAGSLSPIYSEPVTATPID